ncbi:MAG: phospho-N-acetylmuramoyl-pentapeptide-transferase [Bacteroidetes bacterium SB0662_bin_6]|nr:phospho-N-acetylmuramoyl-pentapeptide-transferase [Bacteroidetes bacterium SB0668_bin_1]MYE05405.1 phospho-N-acetylmuramoyl-pentapeptide-transferase [Bacteroidetes bacterium SB0662_bin_6]
MLYYLIDYLEQLYQPPGFQVIRFITVRATLGAITALFISLFIGRRIINMLSAKQLGESVREGALAGVVDHTHKAGTPTMGGAIIILSILLSTFLWGAIAEPYVWLAMLAMAWMGVFGFMDDYIKTFRKDKRGLAPKVKLAGQISIGLLIGAALCFHPAFEAYNALTYVPFLKDKMINYDIFGHLFGGANLGWLVYIPVAVFIMTAVSNGVNLTDGLDGLATGVTAFVGLGLVVLCYISGNVQFAEFLDVFYLPGAGELTVFAAAMTAACFGFLWFNGYPATVFMGDTGSLALGAAVASLTLMIRMELLLPLLGAVYFMETLSVIIQTTWFRWTRRRTGEGKRVFRMAPLHHHFEARGTHEAKIVTRFWIITAVTVVATLLVLRIR